MQSSSIPQKTAFLIIFYGYEFVSSVSDVGVHINEVLATLVSVVPLYEQKNLLGAFFNFMNTASQSVGSPKSLTKQAL